MYVQTERQIGRLPEENKTWRGLGTNDNGQEVKSEWDMITIAEAEGLLEWLEDEEFITFMNFFQRVMPQADILYGFLQKREISVDSINKALT